MSAKLKTALRNACLGLLGFAVAMAIWLPCLHLCFRKPLSDFYRENGISPKARKLAARHDLTAECFPFLVCVFAGIWRNERLEFPKDWRMHKRVTSSPSPRTEHP